MKIIVPTSWADVTLKQFIELSKVPELGFDEWDSQLKVLEILTGIPDDELYLLPLVDLKVLIKKTSFILEKDKSQGIKYRIKIAGQRYRVNYDPKLLTTGEYIDVQEYLKEGNKKLHKVIAVYLKPVNFWGLPMKGCYKKNKDGKLIQTLDSREKTELLILEHMKMVDVFPISAFFLNLWGRLIEATQVYLEKKHRKMNKQIRQELKKIVS